MPPRLIALILRNRIAISTVWLGLTLGGIFGAVNLSDHLTTSVSIPGSQSEGAELILQDAFGDNSEGSFTVLYKFKNATEAQIARYKASIEKASSVIPTGKVTTSRALGGVLVASVSTSLKLTEAAKYTPLFRAELGRLGLSKALVSGPPAINHDVIPVLAGDLHKGQLLAFLFSLLILILLFGFHRAIFLPFAFALVTISTSLGIIYLLATKILMVTYIPNIIELIGLGLAIDYSLLIIHRFRNEVEDANKLDLNTSISKTLNTAGRTVIFSGLTISTALATLILVPIPFVRSVGISGMIVGLVSVLAAATFQPILLSILGGQVMTFRNRRFFAKSLGLFLHLIVEVSKRSIKSARFTFALTLSILILASSGVLLLQVTPSSLTALPKNLDSAKALTLAIDKVGEGLITPHQIVIDSGAPGNALTPQFGDSLDRFVALLGSDPEIFLVASDKIAPFIDSKGRYLRVLVVGRHNLGATQSKELVSKIRNVYLKADYFPSSVKMYLAGAPTQGVDLLESIYSSAPWILLLMLLLSYLLLVRIFKSIILPIKAIALGLLSISSTFGILAFVFNSKTLTNLLGLYQLDQLEVWALVFLFVLIFGLTMDYEVFITSRIREAWDNGLDNESAVMEGMRQTAGVVSAAGIIMIGAVSGLILGSFAGLQEIGVGIAVGVFVDITLIRLMLLPSLMILLGKWNWWLPESIAKTLKIKPSALKI